MKRPALPDADARAYFLASLEYGVNPLVGSHRGEPQLRRDEPEPAPQEQPSATPSGPTPAAIRRRQIVGLHTGDEQLTVRQIVARLGCTKATVQRALDAHLRETQPA